MHIPANQARPLRIPSHPMNIRPLPLLGVFLLMIFAPSCTGWPRGWRDAKKSTSSDGLSGAWEGTWRSTPSGHSGKLRCAVFPKSPGVWEYRYRATWAKVLCAGFTVDCEAKLQKDGTRRVTGQRDLGPVFGGVFTHEGTVSGDKLNARYHAALDDGILTLRRLAGD